MKLALAALGVNCILPKHCSAAPSQPAEIQNIPPRSLQAPTGTQFVRSVEGLGREERERAILNQLQQGNMPSFLRKLVPIQLTHRGAGPKALRATVFAMPEYLAIGSDDDFLRIPMNLHTALALAKRFNFSLPTKKMVDAIYDQAQCRYSPQPLPAGPSMTTTEYYRIHNSMIDEQAGSKNYANGALVGGHKKDVVITNRLNQKPGRIAIYGWHRGPGEPIQPLSTVHGADYADYSHGIRFIAQTLLIEGDARPLQDVLRDSQLAGILSDEGAIHVAAA